MNPQRTFTRRDVVVWVVLEFVVGLVCTSRRARPAYIVQMVVVTLGAILAGWLVEATSGFLVAGGPPLQGLLDLLVRVLVVLILVLLAWGYLFALWIFYALLLLPVGLAASGAGFWIRRGVIGRFVDPS